LQCFEHQSIAGTRGKRVKLREVKRRRNLGGMASVFRHFEFQLNTCSFEDLPHSRFDDFQCFPFPAKRIN
jgi:hypothetical protein